MSDKSILINEQQYLSCILNNPSLIKNEEFNYLVNDISRDIFTTLKKLHAQGVSFTSSTVVSECLKINKDITVEIVNGLKEKVGKEEVDFQYYRRRVITDFVKNKVGTDILKNAATHFLSKGELNIVGVQKTIEELQWAIDTVTEKNTQLRSFKEILDDYEVLLMSRGATSNFMPTGLSFLDEHLTGGGIPKGQFITLFSGPGMGKTTTVLNMLNGNINRKTPLIYYPIEMGEVLSMDKLCSLRTKIALSDFYKTDRNTGAVEDYILEAVRKEKARLSRNKYFKLASSSTNLKTIHENIKQTKNEWQTDSVQVVIDLFTQLEEGRGDNKASAYQDLCDSFFDILNKEKSTGIIVVQSRRKEGISVSNYEDCRKYAPKIEEIKNAAAFEERSRAILSVFRQKHIGIRTLGASDPEIQLADDVLELSILKQNLGELSTLNFLYQGDCGKLYKIDSQENNN